MKLFCLILIVIFTISINLVSAETQIHSAAHYSGDIFELTDDGVTDVYTVSYFYWGRLICDDDNDDDDDTTDKTPDEVKELMKKNRLYLKKNNVGITLYEGECEDDKKYQYCFDGSDWCDKVKYESGEVYPALTITINRFGPDLTVKRELHDRDDESVSELNLEEEGRMLVEITNSGDKRAQNLIYEEYVPYEGMEIWGESGFNKLLGPDNITLSWDGFLDPDRTMKFSYRLRPFDYLNFVIPATLQYDFLGETFYEDVSDFTYSVITPYTFTSSLTSSSIIEKVEKLSVTIKNTDTIDDLDVLLRFQINRDLAVINTPITVQSDGETYVWSGVLGPDKSKTLEFEVRGTNTGEYDNKVFGEFFIRNEEYFETQDLPFKLTSGEITPIIKLFPGSIEGGKTVTVRALIENPTDDEFFQNIKGVLTGDLLSSDVKIELEEISSGVSELLFDEELVTPITNENLDYKFYFEGSYQLSSFEIKPFSTEKTLRIIPSGGELFEITQEFEDGFVKRGELTQIKVLVKNLKESGAYRVEVEDFFPEGLKVEAGNKFNIVDIDGKETRQVYFYKLRVPEDYVPDSVDITTKVNFEEFKIESTKSFNVINNTNETVVEVNDTEDNPTEEETPEPVEETPTEVVEEKKSFWQRVKNFFGNLF